MKKINTLLIGLMILMGFELNSNAQSLTVVNGTIFLPQDSVEFTFESPNFSSTDWIGIYRIDEGPEANLSVVWSYIPDTSGTLYLQAPDEEGWFKAFLLCCDGYDTIAISSEFQVVLPLLTSNSSMYAQGDSMVFTYVSPKFSDSD